MSHYRLSVSNYRGVDANHTAQPAKQSNEMSEHNTFALVQDCSAFGGGPIQAACLQLVTHCVNHSRHRCCFDLIGVPDDTVLLFSRQSPSMQLCARCVLLMDCKHRTHFIRSLMELTLLKKDGSALSRRSQLMLQTLLSADDTPDKMSGYRSRDN